MSRVLPCWKCGKSYEIPEQKLMFRAECDECGSYLHCCRNCKHYKPGLPNDCWIPNTEPVVDREVRNLCEEFEPLGEQIKKSAADDARRKLFGDEPDDKPPSSPIDSLFKD